MMFDNNATIKRRELLTQVARLCLTNELVEKIDTIPKKRFPKNGKTARCCIHKARAIVRQRVIAVLGFNVEDDDEATPLSDYAERALARTTLEKPILTVIDEACSACIQTQYMVTNACRGCLARPCQMNCPRDAINMDHGKAVIDPEKCINCGICKKVCPYHAVIHVPVPCEEACPVDAIMKDETGKEYIDYSKCIFCGKCSRACPFGAIMEKTHIVDVVKNFNKGKKSVAMLAPAIVGQFPGSLNQLAAALKELGFADVIEVAVGAQVTAEKEAAEFIEKMEEGDKFMTTSCCPAYTETVEKHIPELKKHVSTTKTPLAYTAELVRKDDPDAVTVFLSPCIAKRKEAIENELIDFVLTFEELGSMFIAAGIDVCECDEIELDNPGNAVGRRFAIVGGVMKSVKEMAGNDIDCNGVIVNGLDKKEFAALKDYATKKAPGNLVEVMSCQGGCVAGPGVICPAKISKQKIEVLENDGYI